MRFLLDDKFTNCPTRKLIQEYVDKSTFKIELENISQLFSNLNVNNNLIETIFDIANENAVNFELNLKKVLKESLEDQQKIYGTVLKKKFYSFIQSTTSSMDPYFLPPIGDSVKEFKKSLFYIKSRYIP